MAIQIPNLGTAPSGTGGDTSRSAMSKIINNFSTTTHAANRLVGTASGNVMEVGAFGVGNKLATLTANIDLNTSNLATGFYSGRNWGNAPIANNADSWGYLIQQNLASVGAGGYELQILADTGGSIWQRVKVAGTAQSWLKFWTSKNTTVDSNGFIKAASPIIKLFADKIEANDEALEQNPVFEKVDVGHYLIKDTEGFSDNGWYIEMPKDANGNVLVAVQYQQLEDNTIEVKTFAKKFDEETGDVVPNLAKPRDIPADRWIDIRLKEFPEPEIEISNTPPEFQPTNLSQAISEMMNGSQQ
ncbi:pyocin knob domain-containing protein [Acinetobacter gerneri]|uniref:pyocin knob domain-containing protein n=1 Tax=Acinetobacter gerneri TaxID=202952 RepID=UPI0028AE66CB|nr:pyocin knob domain-containing protein [Acinetobacter gerneri]